MLTASAADLLEPWPLKVVVDHVLGGKAAPRWLARLPIPHDPIGLLDASALALVAGD